MKLQHKCDSQIQNKQQQKEKEKRKSETTTTKTFCFHKGFMLQCAKPNSNQNETLQGNHHQLKISCSKYVVKNPHAPKTKSPQNWFICYYGETSLFVTVGCLELIHAEEYYPLLLHSLKNKK